MRRACALIIAASVAASLPAHAASLGGDWRDATDMGTLLAVANETTIGTAWWCQLAATILLGLSWRTPERIAIGASAGISAALLGSFVVTGHAAMHDSATRVWHRLNDLLHLVSAGAWFGALPIVCFLMQDVREPPSRASAKRALLRFSSAGHIAVALTLISGAVNTGLIVGDFPFDWTFRYQTLLTLKSLLVIVMVVAAIVNRYVLVPHMSDWPQAGRMFYWGTVFEIGLSVAVIGLVAYFGMLEPN